MIRLLTLPARLAARLALDVLFGPADDLGTVTTSVHLDGRRVAQAVADRQNRR